jgi:hypothetical protein
LTDAVNDPGAHARSVNEQAHPRPLSIASLIALHLAPGALAVALFVLIAGPVGDAGYPPLLAFLLSVAFVLLPAELAIIALAARREAAGGGLFSPIRFRQPLSGRDWLVVLPVTLVVSIVAFGALSFLEPGIRDGLFGWLPGWFRELVDTDAIGEYSAFAWGVTLVAYVALNVFIGPVVEELYFRGYLLPRMTSMGRWAPLVNTTLFSLYHFWTPWAFISRIGGVAPFAYAVWWKRNIFLGMAVHVLLNAVGTLTLVALVLGELP